MPTYDRPRTRIQLVLITLFTSPWDSPHRESTPSVCSRTRPVHLSGAPSYEVTAIIICGVTTTLHLRRPRTTSGSFDFHSCVTAAANCTSRRSLSYVTLPPRLSVSCSDPSSPPNDPVVCVLSRRLPIEILCARIIPSSRRYSSTYPSIIT